MKFIFKDFYKNKVQLSFEQEPFSKDPKHVWVIARYEDKWLMTKHKSRGVEFPGGKVEPGETADVAAIREVMEETGATVQHLHYIAQYHVAGKSDSIIKNVYFARIERMEEQVTYYETEGPRLFDNIPSNIKENDLFSFMMKDDVLTHCLAYIERHFAIKKLSR